MHKALCAASVAIALGLTLWAPGAEAHGVLSASQPQGRAVLSEPPAVVTLTFTEAPEVGFSSVQVLDRQGGSYGTGRLEAAAGDPQTLRLALRPLDRGVYTVNWRIVSRVDGHLTAGSFAFGVGQAVTDDAIRPAASVPTNRSVLGVGGRSLLYAGFAVVFGGAWVGAAGFRERRRPVVVLMAVGWAVAAAGTLALGEAQRQTTGAALGDFLRAPLGRSVLWRGAGLGIAGLGLVIMWRAVARRWPAGVALVAAGTVATAVAHAHAGHASSASGAMVAVQSLHFLAAAGWIGGLAALLVGLGRRPGTAAVAVARRYGVGAGLALGALVATGVLRAVGEVGSWGLLVETDYGRLVMAKSGLLLGLAALGGLNHYRSAPAAGQSLRGLRRVGVAELAVGATAFAVTGLLATGAPPSRDRPPPPSVVVIDGSDFGTTVKVRLSASPGAAGDNRFSLRLRDYDSDAPVSADRVTARFALPANPGASETSLQFVEGPVGTYSASGTNLAVPGRWRVTLEVQRSGDSVEVPLTLVTDVAEPQVTESRAPGQVTIWDVALAGGRSLQVYTDPERPGPSQFHATFFSDEGKELEIESATVTVVSPDGEAVTSTPKRSGPGHFVADLVAPPGRWALEVTAITPGGDSLFVPLVLTMPS